MFVRRRVRYLISAIALVCLTSVFFPKNAYAYIDLGTGSYILQLAIAFLLGALFKWKVILRNIKSFCKNLLSKGRKDYHV